MVVFAGCTGQRGGMPCSAILPHLPTLPGARPRRARRPRGSGAAPRLRGVRAAFAAACVPRLRRPGRAAGQPGHPGRRRRDLRRSPLSVAAAAPYKGAVRDLILHFKEHGRTGARALLGGLLAEAVAALPADTLPAGTLPAGTLPARAAEATHPRLWLVPVPASRRRRSSGRDPVRELAGVAAATLRRTGRPARVLPVLRCVRAVADQAGLSEQGRAANVCACVRLPSPRHGGLVRSGGARR